MAIIDWIIIGLFVLSSIAIALRWRGRSPRKDSDQFFVAGRSLGWFLAGTSMVATTFSSDTPLFVAGSVRSGGISANWIWWSAAIGTLASVFFFAQLWRRTGVTTEVELITLRYDASKLADCLRVLKALMDGVFLNCIVMASVTLAVSKISVDVMGLSEVPLFYLPLMGGVPPSAVVVAILGIIALGYSTISGFSGVVWSDALQFLFAMIGAIALMGITFYDLHNQPQLAASFHALSETRPDLLRFFPEMKFDLNMVNFLILITVGWLPYAPGQGYFLQRVLASKSERDAALGYSWFAFCHYVLRSWPWIGVAVASMVYFPDLVDGESSYPEMINLLMPPGLKGIVVASLLAAYMSTITSQLNWGSSYIVTDIYKPYIKPTEDGHHYVFAGRAGMVGLAVLTALIIPQITSIVSVYKYINIIVIGSAFSLVARWYWWRIGIVAETVGVTGGLIFGNLMFVILPDTTSEDYFAVRMFLTLVLSALATIIAAYVTSRGGPTKQTLAFYEKVRIQGPGWRRVREQLGLESRDIPFRNSFQAWVGSLLMLYGALLSSGYALFMNGSHAFIWVGLGVLGYTLFKTSGFRFSEN